VFTFIESSHFARYRQSYLDDDEFAALQQYLIDHPDSGDLIQHTGGVRKLRWSRAGMGKRSGLRVIYLVRLKDDEIWLLTLYTKSMQDDIPTEILIKLKETFRHG
jgi:hypothetical protein